MTRRNRYVTRTSAAAALLAVAACASAGKRIEQGGEAAARGDWYEAASRYVEALEKDPTLAEAREALTAAGDSAVRQGLERAGTRAAQDDPVGAADQIRRLDRLFARARGVRTTIPTPDDWTARRRAAFDDAVERLMADASTASDRHDWGGARDGYHRVREDFEPSPAQARASLDAEAGLLVDQAGVESMDGRFRAAYQHAGEALALDSSIPEDVADAAADLQRRSLASGVRVVAVFPVESTEDVRRVAETELDGQLSDLLELEHWRQPPPFVAVADPAAVRQTTRRLFPSGTTFRPGGVIEEVGADFGVLVELTGLTATERDVKSRTRSAKTRDGRQASYTVESGQVRYVIEATITLFDEHGGTLVSTKSYARESGRFERGVYEGDPQQLDLTRGERLLFDAATQRQQRGDAESGLLTDLAGAVAGQVFDQVLRRIP